MKYLLISLFAIGTLGFYSCGEDEEGVAEATSLKDTYRCECNSPLFEDGEKGALGTCVECTKEEADNYCAEQENEAWTNCEAVSIPADE